MYTTSDNPLARWLLSLVALAFLVATGCDSSPNRFEVTGTLKIDGTPVPMGMIVMTPDKPKGNSGPQGIAEVRDGTIVQTHREIVGGPHWLEIHTFDGVAYEDVEGTVQTGKPILEPQRVQVDLPRANAEVQIDMRKDGGGQYVVDVKVSGA